MKTTPNHDYKESQKSFIKLFVFSFILPFFAWFLACDDIKHNSEYFIRANSTQITKDNEYILVNITYKTSVFEDVWTTETVACKCRKIIDFQTENLYGKCLYASVIHKCFHSSSGREIDSESETMLNNFIERHLYDHYLSYSQYSKKLKQDETRSHDNFRLKELKKSY